MVQGGQKRSLVGFWSLSSAFWRTLYQTKVARHPELSGVGHLIGPQIRKDLCVSGGMVPHFQGEFTTQKPQGQGIGLEEPAGPWKAYVWLSQHSLLIILNLTLKFSF